MKLPVQQNEFQYIPYGSKASSKFVNDEFSALLADHHFLFALIQGLLHNPKKFVSGVLYSWGDIVYTDDGKSYVSLINQNNKDVTDTSGWQELDIDILRMSSIKVPVNVNSDYTAKCGDLIYADTSDDGEYNDYKFQITLPTSPFAGCSILIRDAFYNGSNRPIKVVTTDKSFFNETTELMLDFDGFDTEIYFNGSYWVAYGKYEGESQAQQLSTPTANYNELVQLSTPTANYEEL